MTTITTPAADTPLTLTVEQAGQLLGISRGAAYRAAACGQIPTIRLGRRLLVPTARLNDLLGIPADSNDAATAGGAGGDGGGR